MVAESNIESRRIRYLLGLCSQDERERIESEYFENDDAFQAMLAAEDDLTDAYARGELTAEERRRFEKYFLTSLRERDRVKFARALAGVVSDTQRVEIDPRTTLLEMFTTWRGALRLAAIAAVIVLVVSVSWLLIEHRKMNDTLRESRAVEQSHAAQATVQPENLPAPSDTPVTQRARHSQIPKVKKNRAKIAPITNTSEPSQRRTVQSLTNLNPGVVLSPRSATSFSFLPSGRTTITVASSLKSITFRLALETPAHIQSTALPSGRLKVVQ